MYEVTYNILQPLEKVVNDQYELKNTDFYQNVSNHYPTKVVKIQLVLGARQDYSPGTPGRRQRVRLRALVGAKGPAECLQPFDFFTTFF